MKKAALVFLFALLLAGRAYAVAEAPAESAAACILLEASSGRVLYEKNADEPMLIASTTKIPTALVVLESACMDDVVVIRPEWTGIEGSSMYLAAGESYTIRELLGGLMLASGNDAAVALACHTAGSVAEFAVRMNALARELGCEHTHFTNPSGLDEDGHYSCARDLARFACRAIENDALRAIFSSKSMTVGENTYHNHNKLLSRCEGVFGLKTGYTMAAGRTLVSCCEREGMTLVCVTLDDRNDWADHAALYDWGYENWHMETIAPPEMAVPLVGGQSDCLTVAAENGLRYPLCADDEPRFSYELPRFVFAGFAAGAELGAASLWLGEECVATLPLCATQETTAAPQEQAPLWQFFKSMGRNIYTF